ncbi:NADH-quinone oxidoreductase subunit L [Maribrevibacterium harenarium]|uniref:Probable inorganic carbon transporter subunit DabB n=1 Tax=Maribrevibacterium harenarium TaxID=2589817 RepID=A0A501WZD5_9GAMM|nr:NADH-quinone oxidoreductase subunit L [Maribrevibacterium harenarium]TPE54120.1 NADH-quinone oxidoreductase subunit L [Maribrevibacterium harenarium]
MTFAFLLPLLFVGAGVASSHPRWRWQAQVLAAHVSLIGLLLAPIVIFTTFWLAATPLTLQTGLSAIMQLLVVVMAWVLIRFSRHYMGTEERQDHYYRWLLFTLGAVLVTVSSSHLLIIWGGWVGISMGLHALLTFYPERYRAVLAAHKKFLLARMAEVLLLVAFWLLSEVYQSWDLATILARVDSQLVWQEQAAALLIALVALMKCAQLPVHGWLMQVVEAPTPVSALLHAGIINLGGYLVLIFYPLLQHSTPALWLLLIVAGLTTVISALIMTTRVSVKVRLAWSTSAQMGLMLVECALGLYELAVLHLLTHSLYKAYAFLQSSSAVQEHLLLQAAPDDTPKPWHWLVAGVLGTMLTIAAILLSAYQGPIAPWLLLAFALSLYLAQALTTPQPAHWWQLLGMGILIGVGYSLGKLAFGELLGSETLLRQAALSGADVWVISLFVTLFVLALALRYRAHRPWVQRLSIALFAGFYLDEWFTKITLRLWPVTLPGRTQSHTRAQAFQSPYKGEKL